MKTTVIYFSCSLEKIKKPQAFGLRLFMRLFKNGSEQRRQVSIIIGKIKVYARKIPNH